MHEFLRWFHLFRLFCELTASESQDFNSTITAALMDPIMLGMQANNQSTSSSSTTTTTTTTNRILRRQQVPTRRNPVILSPLQLLPSRNVIQSESNSQPQNERLIESSSQRKQLDPIIPIHRTDNRRRKTFTQNTTTKTDGIAYNSPRESTIKALKSSIQNVNQKECSFLISQPIAKTISAMELFELLKLAKSKAHSNSKADYHSKVSAKSREIFFELYNRIVIIIVPRYYPERLNVFLKYLVQESVSNGLMVKALKNVSLLNSDQLIDFINYTEKACICDKINNVDVKDYNRLTTILVHTALNIDPLFLNVFRSKMQSKWKTEMEMKVKYIYELSSLAPLLGGIYEHDNEDSLILNINELILSAMERFSPKLKETIHIFNVLISAVQVEEYRYGKASLMSSIMQSLHELILNDSYILENVSFSMQDVADLQFYISEKFYPLVQARLIRHRNKLITKSQTLQLLNTANNADRYESEAILLILAFIRIDESFMSESDYAILQFRPWLLLKLSNTIPNQFEGDICTSHERLRHQIRISWQLPEDLFIPDQYNDSNYVYPYVEALMDVPRLFLNRVFQIPLSFAKVDSSANEFPEMKELLDVSNFFLERWCALRPDGPYSTVTITKENYLLAKSAEKLGTPVKMELEKLRHEAEERVLSGNALGITNSSPLSLNNGPKSSPSVESSNFKPGLSVYRPGNSLAIEHCPPTPTALVDGKRSRLSCDRIGGSSSESINSLNFRLNEASKQSNTIDTTICTSVNDDDDNNVIVPFSPARASSQGINLIERETCPKKLASRQKQIDYGKNTAGYSMYTAQIPRNQRKRGDHPWTPNKYQICSKRSWDGQVRKWRRALHRFDPDSIDERDEEKDENDENVDVDVDSNSCGSYDSNSINEDSEC